MWMIPAAAKTAILVFGACALIFLGIFALVHFTGDALDTQSLRDGTGEVVTGEVVQTVQQPGGSGSGSNRRHRFCPEYRFETAAGEIYRTVITSNCSTDPNEPAVGSSAEILYDPADPSDAVLNGESPVGGFVIGGISLLLGTGILAAVIVPALSSRRGGRR